MKNLVLDPSFPWLVMSVKKTIFNERRFFESKVTVWVLRRIGFFVNYLLHVVVDIGDFAQSQQLKLGTWRTPV